MTDWIILRCSGGATLRGVWLAALLRKMETQIPNIPVVCFGWEETGCWLDGFGVRHSVGRWHWPEEQRLPFYEHNRRVDYLRCRLRKLASRLEGRLYSK